MINTVLLSVIVVLLIVCIVLLMSAKSKVQVLQSSLELTLAKYILVVRSLGVAEGNKAGKAEQVAIQKKIEKGISEDPNSQKIEGTVTGTLQNVKLTRKKRVTK
jgi:hypothetical protein